MTTSNKPELLYPLTGALNRLLNDNLAPNERVLVRLRGQVGEALVATDTRVMILKTGYLWTGEFSGRRVKSYPLSQISSVKLTTSTFAGRLEIMAPGTKERPMSLDFQELSMAENLVSYGLGVSSVGYKEFAAVAAALRKLVEEVQAVKRSTQGNSAIADELAKLATLRDQGVITAEEFEVAKRRVLGLD